jgi:hypothetical protein
MHATFDPPTADTLEPLDPRRLQARPALSKLSWVLIGGLILCGGFLLGDRYGKDEGGGSSGIPGLPAGLSLPAGFDPSALLGGGAGGGTGGGSTNLPSATTSSGEVVLVSGGKVYVKLPDGSSKAVSITSGTDISTATPADKADIKVGDRVIIDGRTEQNGVIAANAIVVQPD